MTQPITITIPHNLGKEEARRRIEGGFTHMAREMSPGVAGMLNFQQTWQGDRLNFEASTLGQKVSGNIDVLPESVKVELDLPPFLAAIAQNIKSRLTTEAQKLLLKDTRPK